MALGNIDVVLSISGPVDSTQGDITVRRIVSSTYSNRFTNGTGALQAEDIGSVSGTVTNPTAVDLDLEAFAGGAGNINFDEIRAIKIENTMTTGSAYITVGGGGTNEWLGLFDAAGDALRLPAGSQIVFATTLANGLAVSGSSKTLRLASSAGALTYKVTVMGTST